MSKPKSVVSTWVSAVRPNTLPASVSPVIVGSALGESIPRIIQSHPQVIVSHGLVAAYADGGRNVGEAFIFWLFALCIQIGTNLHNDYADFVKGADTSERLGQARATQKGWLTATEVATGATVALGLAGALGVRLIARGGWSMVFVVLTSEFNAVAYTGGPYPLGYIHPKLGEFSLGYLGLGDLFVLLYFGYVAVCGTYFLQHLTLTDHVLWVATPVGFLATAIIVVNNLRDRKTDVKANKLTMAVRFGARFARIEYDLLLPLALFFPSLPPSPFRPSSAHTV